MFSISRITSDSPAACEQVIPFLAKSREEIDDTRRMNKVHFGWYRYIKACGTLRFGGGANQWLSIIAPWRRIPRLTGKNSIHLTRLTA
jgi:hypothetical protein